MFTKLNPKAASVGAMLMALVFLGASQATAQFSPTSGDGGSQSSSTTCGAGTVEKCSEVFQVICDWKLEFSVDPVSKAVTFKFGKSDCKTGGKIPIYKNTDDTSLFSGSCDLLLPFLGMPAGTGCSE